ncbi:MAG: hypothetical protein U9N81_05370 [Bacillota bacterium]|nr:hypothetical protein [Bacillota bacterium]
MAFKITDVDNSELTLSATSNNMTLIPNDNLSFNGTGENRTITVLPLANQSGSAVITVNVSDGEKYSEASFTANVYPVNDIPSFTKGPDKTVNLNAGAQSFSGWAAGISAGPDENSQNVEFYTSNNNNALFAVQPAISSSGTLTFTPAPDKSGNAQVTTYLQDDGVSDNGGQDTSAASSIHHLCRRRFDSTDRKPES